MLCCDYGLNWWEWPRGAYIRVHITDWLLILGNLWSVQVADIVKSVISPGLTLFDANTWTSTISTIPFALWLFDLIQQSGDCVSSPEMEYNRAAGVWSRWEQHLEGWAGGPVVTSLKWFQSQKQIELAMNVLVTFIHSYLIILLCKCLIWRKCCCSWTTNCFQQNKRRRKHSNLNLNLCAACQLSIIQDLWTQYTDWGVRLI